MDRNDCHTACDFKAFGLPKAKIGLLWTNFLKGGRVVLEKGERHLLN
jgi:hypothetical protein